MEELLPNSMSICKKATEDNIKLICPRPELPNVLETKTTSNNPITATAVLLKKVLVMDLICIKYYWFCSPYFEAWF